MERDKRKAEIGEKEKTTGKTGQKIITLKIDKKILNPKN